MRNEKVVVIGGGTGTNTALLGLKRFTRDLTAVVTMADDGGSSGRLRDEFGHLPPGDARQCLVALSANQRMSRTLRTLFEYRFDRGVGLNGHSFGNLFLTALTEITGSSEAAIQEAARLLNVRGRVLPATITDTRLWAELEDGTLIRGEHNIDVRMVKPDMPLRRVFLQPAAQVFPESADAIREAELLVIGPGDLYTSIIPNLLVDGVVDAIRDCRGTRVFACNLMTKHGETDRYAASDFLAALTRYLGGPGALDCMVVNVGTFPQEVVDRYAKAQCNPVPLDYEKCKALVQHVFVADMVAAGNFVRHDPRKLSQALFQVHRRLRPATRVVEVAEAIAARKPALASSKRA